MISVKLCATSFSVPRAKGLHRDDKDVVQY